MHVRKRYAAMLAIAALIVGVVLFQAVTAKPPEPYVRIAGMPQAPVIRTRCEDGEWVRVYTGHDGVEYRQMHTGVSC